MHCSYCILTSLISQALLQAALDKKERDFTGWFSQYEFLNLPVCSRRGAQRRFVQCQSYDWQPPEQQPLQEALAQAYQVGCLATTALACKIKRHRHRERHWHTGCYRTTAGSREASRLPGLAICSRFQCQHPWLFF
jgi:hypothetical protein